MADKTGLLDVIEAERRRHPRMDERDLRKLIYQSSFGGDHLLGDPLRYADALHREWEGLSDDDPSARMPAIQSIDPDGKVARIHLAACRRLGVDIDSLARLLSSQGHKNGKREDYERRWREAIVLAVAGRIPFSPETLARLGCPEGAPHHGPSYGPASYRVANDVSDPRTGKELRRLGVR